MAQVKAVGVLLIIVLVSVSAWKTCPEVPFCNRIRKNIPTDQYRLTDIHSTNGHLTGKLITDNEKEASLTVAVSALENDIFRILIDDVVPSTPPRYRATQALNGEPKHTAPATVVGNHKRVTILNGKSKAIVQINPFQVEFYHGDRLVSIVNKKQRLIVEQKRPHVAVGLDIEFPEANRAYGLPERAERLALRSTTNKDPYRHFNVDYHTYKLESTESLYGSIPVLYAHATTHSSGAFWLNAAQTFVEIEASPDIINTFFMSESGAIDLFILTGPTLPNAVKQYTKLTGTAPLPQYFTLAYHQCRYSYMTQDEVKEVVRRFDENKMPVDVVWLDIDYTLGKKYFTWDPIRFSDPIGLQKHLSSTGRKLVAIIDPHIKNETGYFLHDEATAKGYYVKNPDGSDYVGECWPGTSSYLDFTNPQCLDYFSSLYETIDTFQSNDLHIWNDMNEPAVFYKTLQGELEFEKTMPLDNLHYNNYEHRDVHNIYGLLQTIGTKKGMLARPTNNGRPFILTRSHFAGIQRYAAVWTGDNYASWEYLQYSYPMCLTEALAGVSFCGADVAGFLGIPDDELYQRWYQAGAWLPFYRGHAATDVPRREPYRYPAAIRDRLRNALNQRYVHLPVWYTLFYEHEKTAEPVIRPITYHYPTDADALSIDNELLVGSDILVAPVMSPGATQLNVYLPGGKNEFWYHIDEDFRLYHGTGYNLFQVTIDSTPVFYRGGSIITRKDTLRQSSSETHGDPFSLYVCPDVNGEAKGRLYVDDYVTFDYTSSSSNYVYTEIKYFKNTITSSVLDNSKYSKSGPISKIIIFNKQQDSIKTAKLNGKHITVSFDKVTSSTILSGFSVKPHEPFTILLDN